MTVKQLIEKLKSFPEDMDVFLEESQSDFSINQVDGVEKREVPFRDGSPTAKVLTKIPVVVIYNEY